MLEHVGGPQVPTLPATVQGSSSIRGAGAGLPTSLSTPPQPPPQPRPQVSNIHNLETAKTKQTKHKNKAKETTYPLEHLGHVSPGH